MIGGGHARRRSRRSAGSQSDRRKHGRAGLIDHPVDQEQCACAQAASGAELTDENVAAPNDQGFDFIRKMMFSIFITAPTSCCAVYIQFSARPPGTTFARVECKYNNNLQVQFRKFENLIFRENQALSDLELRRVWQQREAFPQPLRPDDRPPLHGSRSEDRY
jgi:hypothetical protein